MSPAHSPAQSSELTLYGYWRSSSAYRVRIALALKGLAYENVPVHLVQGGGEQRQAAYRAVNPQGYVPCLVHDGRALSQSLAIIDYLDGLAAPQLIPQEPRQRADVLSFALAIAADTQPLQNLSVLQKVAKLAPENEAVSAEWSRHWIARSFAALEQQLAGRDAAPYCFGDAPTLADVVLVPQMYNARRFALPLEPYPNLVRVAEHCEAQPAFVSAHPDQQPDAQPA